MRTFFSFLPLLINLILVLSSAGQSPLKMRDSTVNGPQTFAMIVGISKYKYVRPLNYADKDAELFRDYLTSPGGGRIKDENIFYLENEKALNAVFWLKGFQWLKAKQLREGDRLFIYLAGHGDAIDEDQFFFLTYDCNPGGDKNNYLAGGAIQLFNLKKKIANETSKGVDVFFIMDACRSHELPGGSSGLSFLNTAVSQIKVGEVMMLAAAAGQESLEDISIGNGHGLFTYYLVDGLSGLADHSGTPDNKVTFQEIKTYVDNKVPQIATERFKRKQDPYFCCNENSEIVISHVDSNYLQNWLKIKKEQPHSTGNSFTGIFKLNDKQTADTALPETYHLFNNAIKNNKITGAESAEEYFNQLNSKFPGNPYTLDARSTLAVEFINEAQARINLYLDCSNSFSVIEKQQDFELGKNLEKAISLLKDEEPEYARSLLSQMYLLKASGDFGQNGKNGNLRDAFQNAYAALSIYPGASFIQNKLALLHLENNNRDSALFYASEATQAAPKWNCALNTLRFVQEKIKAFKNLSTPKKKINSIGFTLGGGITRSKPTFRNNPTTNVIAVNSRSTIQFNPGIFYAILLGNSLSFRPEAGMNFGNITLLYNRRNNLGEIIRELITLNNTSVNLVLPLLFNFKGNNTVPYIAIGPSFSYILSQSKVSSAQLPIKNFVMNADAGFGIDFASSKSGILISPEIRYSIALSDLKNSSGNTPYTNSISSLKKQAITLNFYIRKVKR